MKKLQLVCASLFITPAIALAQNAPLQIVNHYDRPLSFEIGINPESIEGVDSHFSLDTNKSVNVTVLDKSKEAYIRGEDQDKNYVFWGVENLDGQANVHGYQSRGIAFSWDNSNIVFCTTDEYKQHNNSCL